MKKFLIAICITLLHFATTGAQEITLDFTTNDWGISETARTQNNQSYSSNGVTITFNCSQLRFFSSNSNGSCIEFGKTDAKLTLPAFNFAVEKIEVIENLSSSYLSLEQNIFVGDVAVSTATKGYDRSTQTCTFKIAEDYQTAGNIYTLKILSEHVNCLNAINIYKKGDDESKRATATTTSYGSDIDGQTFTVYGNNTFEGKTATVTPSSTEGTLTYSSSDTDVATVNASTGEITLGESYGSTTITAQFTPTDATAYETSSAYYVIVHKESEPSTVTKTVTFDAKTDKSKTTKLEKDGVIVSVTEGNFSLQGNYYSIYKGENVTFSTEIGNITSIVITWRSGDSYKKYRGLTGDGFSNGDKKGTWTGKAPSVTLTNTGSEAAYIATITVTVSTIEEFTLTDALESEATLTDNLGKTMNVTVGRTMNTGSGYYTLCLPFDVPAEKMTALKGASVLQYDGRDDTTLKFAAAESITAGRAYLVMPKEKIENPLFEEVTISATQPLSTSNDYDFVGTLTKTSLATDGTNLFVGANNVLTIPTIDDYIIGGLRAYFRVPLGTNEAKLSLLVDDQQASIPLIPISPNSSSAVYTVGGVNLGRSVPRGRGIYIIGGKKTLKLEN